ncbi:Elongator complex protein 4 [Chytridium lagenaria]|nr:Elongator complex protein 4 [Chytridium lagenaria]
MSSFKRRTPTAPTTSSRTTPLRPSSIPISPLKPINDLPISSRISPHTGLIQTSTGIPSLDGVLGGGLPTSTLHLLQQDHSTSYTSLLTSYFLAQGISAGHGVFYVDEDPTTALEALMAPVGLETEEVDEDDVKGTGRTMGALREEERMSIAWRYQNQPKVSTAIAGAAATRKGDGPYCYKFDITKKIPKPALEAASASIGVLDVSAWAGEGLTSNVVYQRIYAAISEFAKLGPYDPTVTTSPRSFLRIALAGVGGPLWGVDAGTPQALQALYRFLASLRALMRNIYGVCVITIPAYLYHDAHGVSSSFGIKRLYHICDGVFEVESFSGSSRNFPTAYTSDYHGLLHVHRLPTPHSLTPGTPLSKSDLHSLAFRVRRKRFTVETFQLPPETEETDQRGPTTKSKEAGRDAARSIDPVITSPGGSSCSTSSRKNPLDF